MKRLRKSLVVMFAFTLLFAGSFGVFSQFGVYEVEAGAGDTNLGGGTTASANPGAAGSQRGNVKCGAYRLTLVPADAILDLDNTYTTSKGVLYYSTGYCGNKIKQYSSRSVLLVDSSLSKDSIISYNDGNSKDTFEAVKISSLQTIFGNDTTKTSDLAYYENELANRDPDDDYTGGSNGTTNFKMLSASDTSLQYDINELYLGEKGPFVDYISECKSSAVDKFLSYLERHRTYDKKWVSSDPSKNDTKKVYSVVELGLDYSELCFVLEPVLITQYGGQYCAIAHHDIFYCTASHMYKDTSINKWLYTKPSDISHGYQYTIAWKTYINKGTGKGVEKYVFRNRPSGGLITEQTTIPGEAIYNFKTYKESVFKNNKGEDLAVRSKFMSLPNSASSGFGIYGAGVSGDTDPVTAKTGSSFTLFYKGNALESDKGISVYASSNFVFDYDSINHNVDNDADLTKLAKGAKSLKLASYGKSLKNPFKTNTIGSKLSASITGISANQSWDDYVLISAGIDSIKYSTAKTGKKTKNIPAAVKSITNDIEGWSVQSKSVNTADGDINIGSYRKLELVDNSKDIVTRVAESLASKSSFSRGSSDVVAVDDFTGVIASSEDSVDDKEDLDDSTEDNKVTASAVSSISAYNIITNYSLKAIECAEELSSVTESSKSGNTVIDSKYTTSDSGSTMGVSVALLAKKKLSNSYIAYATLNGDDGTLTYGTNDSIEYDISGTGTFEIPESIKKKSLLIAFPNDGSYTLANDLTGSTIFEKVRGKSSVTLQDLATLVTKQGSVAEVQKKVSGGQTIEVGSSTSGVGYSIIVLQLKGSVTKTSKLELMDYELNYVFPSMLTDYSSISSLNDEATAVRNTNKDKWKGTTAKTLCNKVKSQGYDSYASKYIKASSNYTGNIIGKNNALTASGVVNKNILQYDFLPNCYFTTESSARSGCTFTKNLANVRFTLAVNLIRSSFGDTNVISSISPQTLDETYASQNLGLTKGNKPANTPAQASAVRNSSATVGTALQDTFQWNIWFAKADGTAISQTQTIATKKKKNSCKLKGLNGASCKKTKNKCKPVTYIKLVATEDGGSDDGTRIKYVINEYAYKYQTAALDTAVNTAKISIDQIPSNDKALTTSTITTPYKASLVRTSGQTLGFYPEVTMLAYSTSGDRISTAMGTVINPNDNGDRITSGGVAIHSVPTMGEVKRNLQPSSMYTIQIAKPASGDAVSGSTISDSTAVGTNANKLANSSGKPVVYAGGNVSVKMNANFTLNMYSYSLDLIKTTDTTLAGVGTYSSVIADSSDVRTTWGNDASYNPKSEFDTWVKDTLSKLAVDTTLEVKGSGVDKTYNNFNTSLGATGFSESTEDGVFQLHVAQGTILETGGYTALINQIASDYGVTTDNAKTMFNNSDIWQTIARAVEDSSDDFNTSRRSSGIANRNHWYDEQVRTFVIRRYKAEGISVSNVLVNDKIDYGAAPTASTGVDSNDSYSGATAKWYMTLYFKSLPAGFTDGTTLYSPSNYTGLSNANNAGTVLVNEVYVNNADFIIPSATTYDMGN